MSIKYRVVYLSQKVQVTDPQYGLILDKQVTFPSFQSAVSFARNVKTNDAERIVGKPVVEEVK